MDTKTLALIAQALQKARALAQTVQLSRIKDDVQAFVNTLTAELPAPPNGVEWTDADLHGLAEGIRAEADHVLDSRGHAEDDGA